MDLDTVASVTQAAAIVICGTFFYLIYLLTIGPVVDVFVYELAGTLPLSAWGQECMRDIIIFGSWWYHIMKILVIVLILWYFVFILKRWRYNRQVDEYDWWEKL